MTIRSRLILLLLPALLLFVPCTSYILHRNWTGEIIANHRSRLETVVITCAQLINAEDHAWIYQHRDHPDLARSRTYQYYSALLDRVTAHTDIVNLYTARIKPVQKGERVLLDQPLSHENPEFNGRDSRCAYRKELVLQSRRQRRGHSDSILGGSRYDFCENKEYKLYYSPETTISSPYHSQRTGTILLTAYAPIINTSGHVSDLVGADISLSSIQPELYRARAVIASWAIAATSLALLGAYLFTKRITSPLEMLSESALAISAGDYGRRIELEGPKEVRELANTFNTMSSCLQEQIADLKKGPVLQSGHCMEKESCVILLEQLFHKPARQCASTIAIEVGTFHYCENELIFGEQLKVDQIDNRIQVFTRQALEPGLNAIVALATSSPDDATQTPYRGVILDTETNKIHRVGDDGRQIAWLWSHQNAVFTRLEDENLELLPHDHLLLLTPESVEMLEQEYIYRWLVRLFASYDTEPFSQLKHVVKIELERLLHEQSFADNLSLVMLRLKQRRDGCTPKMTE